ncbi:MAG: hypothetical protein ACKVOP_07315 [Sphingomonadaceae bacterium]
MAIAEAVQASALGSWMRQSPNAYPVANVLHLLGLVMLVGGIGFVDLRLAGAFRTIPLRPLVDALTPVAIAGFVLSAGTGALLFAADAVALATSATFRWKLLLVMIAIANALVFRSLWRPTLTRATPLMRLIAIASLALWLAVATLGRLIAYW